MIRTSEQIIGMQVLSINEAKTIGKVCDVIVDTKKRKISFLAVNPDKQTIVSYGAIANLGEDAVMIPTENSLAEDMLDKSQDNSQISIKSLIKCAIFTQDGKSCGELIDFAFDTKTGKMAFISSRLQNGEIYLIDMSVAKTFGKEILIIRELLRFNRKNYKPIVEQKIELADTTAIIKKDAVTSKNAIKSNGNDKEIKQNKKVKNAGDLFERNHARLMLGKCLARDIILEDGTILAKTGDTVNENMLQKIIQKKQLVKLMVSVNAGEHGE